MIKHIVMWKLKDTALDCTAQENALRMRDMLEELKGKVPTLKHIEVATATFGDDPACDVVLYSEFDSREDLDIYQAHPAHQRCVGFIRQVVAERRAVDYEI